MPAPTVYSVTHSGLLSALSGGAFYQYSFTVPSGLTNSALVVCLHGYDFLDTTAITGQLSVNWPDSGGSAMTVVAEGNESSYSNAAIYTSWAYLVNPSATTNNIYITSSRGSAISDLALSVFILENVDQTTPLNASNSGTGGGTTVSSLQATITGTSTNSLTLYGWTRRGGNETATVSGATEQTDAYTGTNTLADALNVTATEAGDSGSQDATASWSTANGATFSAIQIEGTSGGTEYTSSLAGTLTTAGAIVRATAKPLAGALTSAGSVVKSTAKSFAGALTSAGSVAKSTGKALAGTVTTAGTIARSTGKALAGTVTTSGAITRAISKTVEGTLTTAGTIARAVSKSFAGAVSFAGALAAQAIEAATGIVNLLSQARDWSLTSKARDWTLTAQARIKDFTSRSRDN